MNKRKVALVTGVVGQDGVLLSELLLSKDYVVHGVSRGLSLSGRARIQRLRDKSKGNFVPHIVDIADASELARLVAATRPTEIYNLAAQSSIPVSVADPVGTFRTNADGVLNLLEAIITTSSQRDTRLFQASTSQIFGSVRSGRIKESLPFNPQNPYAESKLRAHAAVAAARVTDRLHASNGILFNHESPLRGEGFVTRKVSIAVAAIRAGRQQRLTLGNLDATRDWGHAREYVEAMWLMLQQDEPDDYILATGVTTSTRDFVVEAFSNIDIQIIWRGSGASEQGVCAQTGEVLVEIDPTLFRPEEASSATADNSRAWQRLGWAPTSTWRELCAEMISADLKRIGSLY